jgi:hypothetical protein
MVDPFLVKSCSLATISTGIKASSLKEFHDVLESIHVGSIYYHFWGRRLHPEIIKQEFYNDFALWAHKSLHDDFLAERLSVIDPRDFENLELLRQKLLDVVEHRIDEVELSILGRAVKQFYFKRSLVVVFETNIQVKDPQELPKIIPILAPSSIFYHLIDARRVEKSDDFCNWLLFYGDKYLKLINKIKEIDPYFSSLNDLRNDLSKVVNDYFEG